MVSLHAEHDTSRLGQPSPLRSWRSNKLLQPQSHSTFSNMQLSRCSDRSRSCPVQLHMASMGGSSGGSNDRPASNRMRLDALGASWDVGVDGGVGELFGHLTTMTSINFFVDNDRVSSSTDACARC